MLRNFTTLIKEEVNEGFERGIQLFTESLETDLSKDMVIESNGLDAVIGTLFEEEGFSYDYNENLSDEDLDFILKEMEE